MDLVLEDLADQPGIARVADRVVAGHDVPVEEELGRGAEPAEALLARGVLGVLQQERDLRDPGKGDVRDPGHRDRIDLSEKALTESAKAPRANDSLATGEIREDLVRRIRTTIEKGEYLTPEKIEVVARRLQAELGR